MLLLAQWRDTLTAGFSQWHGTRKGAVSLLNGTADANETVAVVDEIPVDAGKTRAVHKNPKDTTWQQCECLACSRQPATLTQYALLLDISRCSHAEKKRRCSSTRLDSSGRTSPTFPSARLPLLIAQLSQAVHPPSAVCQAVVPILWRQDPDGLPVLPASQSPWYSRRGGGKLRGSSPEHGTYTVTTCS